MGTRYDFERLDVYQKALDFAEEVFKMTERFPQQVQSSLGDQLRRSALSICNNLAEGSQKRGAAKRQFYGYALDSSRECVPVIELAFRRRLVDESLYRQLGDTCYHIDNMLYRMMLRVG